MLYAYIRVSKVDQNIERQIDSIMKYNPNFLQKNIFHDKKTGKTMARTQYQKLKKKLVRGDELVIHELDRLGRDKDAIKNELLQFKQKGVIVRILNIPTTLTPFPNGQEWVCDMINNLLIEVYATIAQNERETISKRTKEGLEAARQKGNYGGRPKTPDHVLTEIQQIRQKNEDMPKADLIKLIQKTLPLARSTIYRYINELEGKTRMPQTVDEKAVDEAIQMYQEGHKMGDIQMATGLSRSTIYAYLKDAEKSGKKINRNKKKTYGRPKIDPAKETLIIKMNKDGVAKTKISKITNTGIGTVYNVLKKHGDIITKKPTNEEKKEIGMIIHTLRESNGLTLHQLAELVGCHESSIQKYEKGYRCPSKKTAMALETALGCANNEILKRFE